MRDHNGPHHSRSGRPADQVGCAFGRRQARLAQFHGAMVERVARTPGKEIHGGGIDQRRQRQFVSALVERDRQRPGIDFITYRQIKRDGRAGRNVMQQAFRQCARGGLCLARRESGHIGRPSREQFGAKPDLGWIGGGWWDRHGRFPEIH